MNKKAVKFLKQCIELYSPSGKEEHYAQFLEDFLKNGGFRTHFDKVGNLIAEKGKGKPHLLLVSHMDTIPGKLPVIKKEGKIFGRGAVDCKPALAAMVYAIKEFKFAEEGKITFAGIVREEDSLIGIDTFLESKIRPDYAIFGEPTKIDQICIGYKGRICFEIQIKTQKGHVASSWEYLNAIEMGLNIWEDIQQTCKKLNKKIEILNKNTRYFNQIIPNLTVINGGDINNCVPSNCSLSIDIRFPPTIKVKEILESIREVLAHYKERVLKSGGKAKVTLEILSKIEGFEIEGKNLVIGALRWAIFKTLHEKPTLIKKTGTTFINKIGAALNIPSITYGPGDPKLEHTKDEYIEISDYLKTIEIYQKFFGKLIDLYKRKNKK
ncbi:MAG: M20/M25/M40 family metallo-hydrolase [Promethearchaeia archaeon]